MVSRAERITRGDLAVTIELKPEHAQVIDQAIRAGLIEHAEDVVDVGMETLRSRLRNQSVSSGTSRDDAIRRMREFGDKYNLSLGEPITRKLLHDGHRY